MKTYEDWLRIGLPAGILLLFSDAAVAERLEAAEDASLFIHWGAAALLYGHILGGILGVVSGFVASIAQKGGQIHRRAGTVFFYSMIICYLIAAVVAPFMETQQRTNFVAAILALYLLLSGLQAARRRVFVAGAWEWIGLFVATAITCMGLYFMWLTQQSATGTVDDSPAQAYVLFVVFGALAMLGEIAVLAVKRLSNKARIARHLWRMCGSFFIASGSLFFGQSGVFPEWFNTSLLPICFGFFPFIVLIIGLWQTARPFHHIKKQWQSRFCQPGENS